MESVITNNIESINLFGTEVIAVITLLFLLLLDVVAPREQKRSNATGLTFLGLVMMGVVLYFMGLGNPTQEIFSGLLAVDSMSILFKAIFLLSTFIVSFMVYESDEITDNRVPEFFIFLLTIFVGMSLMASGLHLLILYLALEMVSLPSYVMAAYAQENRNSAEAGLKYMIYGAAAGGSFLYGATLLYGLTGAFTLSGIAAVLSSTEATFGVMVSLVLILIGIGYKCSFFPMHMWVPDVYQGAPAAVGGFLSTAPKAAGFAMLIRMSWHFVPALGENPNFFLNLSVIFFVISAITMTVGNLSALLQNNVKRLLGYSTVAHVGYMLMGYALVGTNSDLMQYGFSAISFYLIIYTVMNLGAFLVVIALDREWLEEFDGMVYRAPVAALTMAVFLFSLTGLPPLAGFVGKFYLFSALIKAEESIFYILAVIGVLNSVVSLFYYARVLQHMFLTEPEEDAQPVSIAPVSKVLLCVLAGLVLGLGVLWNPVMEFAQGFMQIGGV